MSLCVCFLYSCRKALRVGFNGSKLVYYSKSNLALELLINRTTSTAAAATAAHSVTAELHNSHWRKRRRRRRTDRRWGDSGGTVKSQKREDGGRKTREQTLQSTEAQLAGALLMQFKNNPLPSPFLLFTLNPFLLPALIHRLHLKCPWFYCFFRSPFIKLIWAFLASLAILVTSPSFLPFCPSSSVPPRIPLPAACCARMMWTLSACPCILIEWKMLVNMQKEEAADLLCMCGYTGRNKTHVHVFLCLVHSDRKASRKLSSLRPWCNSGPSTPT